jgi:2-keto-4-pentenoate hydratase
MKADTGRRRRTVDDSEVQAIATRFVEARLLSRPLADFPGEVPADLETAYRCQDAAIERWPDRIAGWKVGRIPEALEERFLSDRLAGPIFRKTIHYSQGSESLELPVYRGGFAAIEGEYVVVVSSDAPEDKLQWTRDEASRMISDLRIGVEMASSPLRSINDLGPAAIVSDFGNNAGLIVGPSISGWESRELESMSCEAFIEGRSVGTGGAFRLSGGPVRSLQFILELAARRGRPLKSGDVIATGQTTGIHDILIGQSARISFAGDGDIYCRATDSANIDET